MGSKKLTTASLGQLQRHGERRLHAELGLVTRAQRITGEAWYDEAHDWVQYLSALHGVTAEQAAGIAAVLSPRLPWSRAISLTEQLLSGENINDLVLKGNAAKAYAIFNGSRAVEVVGGNKVTSFYHNLLTEYHYVSIDKWSFEQVAGIGYADNYHLLERAGVYEMYAQAFREVARDANTEPALVQAALWVMTRERANNA